MQKYIMRPLFKYLARRKRRKDLQHKQREEQQLWQQLLADKLAERQAMTAETEHRIPTIKKSVADVPTNRLLRINSSTLEKLTMRQEAPYCVLYPTPSLSGPLVTTDPLTRIPKPLFPNPMYVEHQRVLTMFRTHVESFVQYFGYIPRAIRVSPKTARIMWILNFDYYAWHEHTIPLFCDALSERLTDEQVECIHEPNESRRVPATVPAPTGRLTQQLTLSDLQERLEKMG